jgi:aminoglycoside 6'-N-acetyltransferase I
MELVDILAASEGQREQTARILVAALAHAPSAWKTVAEAREEVALFVVESARRALLAVESGTVLGWIGAIAGSSQGWELHPLVVDPPAQRRGVGSALVQALEKLAADAGAATLWLGADDDFGGTSLYGADLYPDPLIPLARLTATAGHPFTFYLRMGYAVCGVIPDANGPGRPDILLAKRVGPSP